ncbi:MAG: mandelate racemase/muconate lactonizing enzyme family protein [Lentisphaerae bacterium]|nr:mandelate racemase/muconate lactonizing enzyme family protein [Lentisphaerota bacterium]
MKITSIETVLIGAPTPGCGLLSNRNYFILRLHTDEGISGLGEATVESHDDSLLGILKDLQDLIVGFDPLQPNRLVQHLLRKRFWKGGVLKASIISGIELACWDIIGKHANKPVYELLGGAVRDKLRVYANGWTGGATDPAIIRDKAHEAMAAGYRAFKFSIALAGWPMHDRELVRKIAKATATVREAIGPDAPLCFDGHGRYDAKLALQVAEVLEDYDVMFFEEPVQPENEEGMAEVAAKSRLPIAAGERLTRPQEFRRLFEKRAIAVAQPDLAHCHGLNEGCKVAHIAEAFDGFVAPHCPMSPLLLAISLHLDAIAPNFLIQERLFQPDWRGNILTNPMKVEDGFLPLPQGAGWGVELNEELVAQHPRIEAGTPSLFRADNSICDW